MHSSLPLKRKETSHRCRSPPVPGEGFQVRELQYFEGNKPRSSKLSPVILRVNPMNKGKNPLIWTKSPTSPPAATGQRHGLDLFLQRFSHLPLVVSSRLNGCLDMEPAGKRRRISYQPVSHSPIAYLHLEEWPQCAHGETGNFQGKVPQSAQSSANLKLEFSLWSSGLMAIPKEAVT